MKQQFYFGSNTKRDLSRASHLEMLTAATELAKNFADVQYFLLPPAPLFGELKARSTGTGVWIGSQQVTATSGRNVTGEISGDLLAEIGSEIVMVGHAERRSMGEDGMIADAQLQNVADANLRALLCIGENVQSSEILRRDVYSSQLSILKKHRNLEILIAYEPIFSIGVGANAAPTDYVEESIQIIRELLGEMGFETTPILYGGSINSENAHEYSSICQGLFVGRSAWSGEGYREVFLAANRTRKK